MRLPVFPVEGGCQCRTVRYRVTAPPLGVYACWCRDCQRASGTTHTLSMPIRREHVELISGELTAYDKAADSGRTVRMMACAACGTRLWNHPLATPEMLVVKPGTLDDMSWSRPVGNIWTASAPDWVSIEDEGANFPGQPQTRQPLFDAWDRAVAAD
jgi:hypothetical protein